MFDLLSLKESVEELGRKESGGKLSGGISIYTLRAWIAQRRIPYVKLGRRVFIRRLDLQDFVNKSVVSAK